MRAAMRLRITRRVCCFVEGSTTRLDSVVERAPYKESSSSPMARPRRQGVCTIRRVGRMGTVIVQAKGLSHDFDRETQTLVRDRIPMVAIAFVGLAAVSWLIQRQADPTHNSLSAAVF